MRRGDDFVREAARFFADLRLSEKDMAIVDKVLNEIRRRLGFLRDVGLDYLTLDRLSATLSGGEAQRINLATSLGSALVGTLYVLDEPSMACTPTTGKLMPMLQMCHQGDTVLVVEHDADIAVADYLIDMGLGAGEHGGRVVYAGTIEGLPAGGDRWRACWRGELSIPVPATRRRGVPQRIKLIGAREHNLKGANIEIPLNTLTVITGVSGSGKSTLIHDVLYAALKRAKGNSNRKPSTHDRLEEHQAGRRRACAPGMNANERHRRINPVTYLKAFNPIRELFASTKEAKARGMTASHFSFNVPGGRCEACQGEGEVKVEMQFARSRWRHAAVRAVRRPSLQVVGPRGALGLAQRHRSARPHGSRGAGVLLDGAEGAAAAAGAGRRNRPRLSAARPARPPRSRAARRSSNTFFFFFFFFFWPVRRRRRLLRQPSCWPGIHHYSTGQPHKAASEMQQRPVQGPAARRAPGCPHRGSSRSSHAHLGRPWMGHLSPLAHVDSHTRSCIADEVAPGRHHTMPSLLLPPHLHHMNILPRAGGDWGWGASLRPRDAAPGSPARPGGDLV